MRCRLVGPRVFFLLICRQYGPKICAAFYQNSRVAWIKRTDTDENTRECDVLYRSSADTFMTIQIAETEQHAGRLTSQRFSPGGPYSSTPFAGALRPVNRSGLKFGNITVSCRVCFTYSSPAIESHDTRGDLEEQRFGPAAADGILAAETRIGR